MFPELPEELRPRRRSLVAGELGPEGLHERRRASPRYAEELLDVAARRIASGMARRPPGLGRHLTAAARVEGDGLRLAGAPSLG